MTAAAPIFTYAAPTTTKRSWKPLRPRLAIPAVALTVFIMAYNGLFAPFSILMFYAIWLPLATMKGGAILLPPKGTGIAFTYLGLCFLSVLWSDYRAATLRAALELASMFLCSLIILRVVPTESYVKGLIIGISVVLLASVVNGSYGMDPFSGNYTLVGLFGSKNQLGFFAELGIYLTTIFWFTKARRMTRLAYVPLPFCLSVYCLQASHSATSVASLAVTMMAVSGVYVLTRLPKRTRRLSFMAAFLGGIALILLGVMLGWQEIALQLLGKDITLTGRTYLWQQGLDIGMRDPFLGVGYSAFWVPGRLEAEHFWYEFFIPGRAGFHFHDTFIEFFVELGFPGLLLVAGWFLTSLVKSLGAVITNGLILDTLVPLGIVIMLVTRSFVEIDIFGQFSMGIMLLFPIIARLRTLPQAAT